MYKAIEFMPNAFQEYLVVDIGFDLCQYVDPPKARTKGTFLLFNFFSLITY